jgi:PAS domain S-box-containing protein
MRSLSNLETRYNSIKTALDSSGAGIWEWNYQTGAVYFDPVWLSMVGYSENEITPDLSGWSNLVLPEDLDMVLKEVDKLLKGEIETYMTEHRLRKKSGEIIWIRDAGKVVSRDENGEPLLVAGTHIDITESKEARLLIEENLTRQKFLANLSQVLNYFEDYDSSINQALEIIGKTVDVSRIYIFEDDDLKNCTNNTYEWCNEGIEPQIQNLQEVPYEILPSWIELLRRDQCIKAINIEKELPEDLVVILKPQNIISILVLPIQLTPTRNLGFIGFDQCDRERNWDISDFELLRTCTAFLANVFRRRQSETDLKASQARYQALVETQKDLILRFTPDGNITFANQAFFDLFNLDRKNHGSFESMGFRLDTLIIEPERYNEMTESLLIHPNRFYVENNIKVDGTSKWFGWELYCNCNKAGIALAEIQATGRDITTQKDYQTKLEQERTKAQKANEAKSMFISKISHELRTPLNSIIGYTDLMTRYELAPKTQSHINAVLKSSKHLKNLIDDLLDFTKIESNKVKLFYTEFDMRPIVNELPKVFSVNLSEDVTMQVEVEDGFPDLIRFDELKLRQMLNNLVGNAVKFTRRGLISVKVSSENKADEYLDLKISVRDTGVGISRDKLTLIFQSFEQIEDSNAPYRSGTGLGLSITQAYVEMVGGKIEVESVLGEGSEFRLTIPRIYYRRQSLEPTEAELIEGTESLPELLGKQILIAEDDPTLANLYSEFLIPSNAEIVKVADGESTLKAIMDMQPDLLVLDLGLPDRSGVEIAKEIRAEKAYMSIPIIAMTGYRDILEHRELFDQVLFKPITKEAFQHAVGEQLMRFSSKHSLERKPSPIDQSIEVIRTDKPLCAKLVKETSDLLERSISTHSISHIRHLMEALSTFAQANQSKAVEMIAEEMARCLDFFDIEGIEHNLTKLSRFYSKVSEKEILGGTEND